MAGAPEGSAGRELLGLRWTYALASLVLIVVYPLLPRDGRLGVFRLVAFASVAAAIVGARVHAARGEVPRWLVLLIVGLVLTNMGLIAELLSGDSVSVIGEALDAGGNVVLFVAALILAGGKGRSDTGGVVDTAITGLALGGLLWNFGLLPIEESTHAAKATEIRAFVVVFALSGVVGALVRLGQVSHGTSLALWVLSAGLVFAIAANIMLAMTAYSGYRILSAMLFMATYTCVGLFALDPKGYRLATPDPSMRDDLTARRLFFLGIAVAVIPVALGISQLFGGLVNGSLLALAGGLITALVMVRIRKLYIDRQRAEQALFHLATHDGLTDLVNRREFERRLEREVSGVERNALLFCDLDGFKKVNDSFGHSAGDQLLVEVARRLTASVRASDTVARLGGDEFLVLLRDAKPDDVDAVLERLSLELSRPIAVDSTSVTVGASIGVVVFDQVGIPDELIQRADHAMYRAKEKEPKQPPVRIASG